MTFTMQRTLSVFADGFARDFKGVQATVQQKLDARDEAHAELKSASALAAWLRMEESMSVSQARLKAALDALESSR